METMTDKRHQTYHLLLYANIALVMLTILSGLASFVNPHDFWLFSFLGLIFPVLILINIVFIVFWCIKKLRYSLFSLVCLFLFYQQIFNSFAFHLPDDTMEQLHDFTIMSYNTSNFRHNVKGKTAIIKKRKEAIQFISSDVHPDILCTQEMSNYNANLLLKKLNNYYVHRFPHRGTMIFSSFPIIKKGEIDFNTQTNSCLWADIKIYDDTLRVYSVHLQSNKISKDANTLINESNKNKDWHKIKTILKNYKKYSISRAQQADMILQHTKRSPYPVLICGDLNDTPQSYTYKTIKNNLQDAFIEKGIGLGVSFGGAIPGLRIDYIFPHPSIQVLAYHKYKNKFSDHYPIWARLKVQK